MSLAPGLHALDRVAAVISAMFSEEGLSPERADALARHLVRAEAMGRSTHGLNNVATYLDHLRHGRMRARGEPLVVTDYGAVRVLDGDLLPGPWLTERVLNEGIERAATFGISMTTVRRSHHIGCLGAIALTASRRGYVALISASGPHSRSVAAHGGVTPVLSPDPFALAVPGVEDGLLIDISSSVTSMSTVERYRALGVPLPRPMLVGPNGEVTDDPAVMREGGSILPLGGREDGHKGTALALLVETMTQGLSGWGRADMPLTPASAVSVQVFDPAAFAGLEELQRQMGFIAEQISSSTPSRVGHPPRVPGQRALRALRAAERDGLELDEALANTLARAARPR